MRPTAGDLQAFLEGIALFGGLSQDTVARLAVMLDPQRYAPGQLVFAEGDHGRNMFVVLEGEVLVSRRSASGERVRLVRLGVGECLGEMTLVDPQPRSATVTAARPTILLALSCKDLYQLYVEDLPGYTMLLQNLCRELSRRLRHANDRLVELAEQGAQTHRTQLNLTALRRPP